MKDNGLNLKKTISTAWLVAYCRTFSDIPFSSEIFKIVNDSNFISKSQIEEIKVPKLAPQLEARYKLINRLILQDSHDQILELASGFSPRSLNLAKDNDIQYIEFDLPGIIKKKSEIISNITKNTPINNIHLFAGNVLDKNALLQATKYFNKNKPITVVNEGLLRYLNFEEKAIVASNIHYLLDMFGGRRITSDITLKSILTNADAQYKGYTDSVQGATNINIMNNCFENEEQAQKFFRGLGFNIERHSFTEVSDILISPKRLQLTNEVTHDIIKTPVVYIMKTTDSVTKQ